MCEDPRPSVSAFTDTTAEVTAMILFSYMYGELEVVNFSVILSTVQAWPILNSDVDT